MADQRLHSPLTPPPEPNLRWTHVIDAPVQCPYNRGFPVATGGQMYAVIRSGGKQYRVAPGETVKVETLPGKLGEEVTFGEVLAVSNDEQKLVTGKHAVGAKVTGKIVSQDRHAKVIVLKFKTGGQ